MSINCNGVGGGNLILNSGWGRQIWALFFVSWLVNFPIKNLLGIANVIVLDSMHVSQRDIAQWHVFYWKYYTILQTKISVNEIKHENPHLMQKYEFLSLVLNIFFIFIANYLYTADINSVGALALNWTYYTSGICLYAQ